MNHHRLRSLRMSALAARASRVCLLCSITLGAFTSLGLAKPAFQSDLAGEVTSSDEAAAQSNTAQSGQTTTTQNPPQQQRSQPPQTQNQNPQQTRPQTPPQPAKPNNPFENVPTTPETAPKTPEKPNPAGVQEAQTVPVGENIIEAVEFR